MALTSLRHVCYASRGCPTWALRTVMAAHFFQAHDAWEAHTFEIRGPAGRRLVQVAIAARATTATPDVSVHLGSLLVRELADVALPAVSNVHVRGHVKREKHSSDLDVVSLLLEWDCPGVLLSLAWHAGIRCRH